MVNGRLRVFELPFGFEREHDALEWIRSFSSLLIEGQPMRVLSCPLEELANLPSTALLRQRRPRASERDLLVLLNGFSGQALGS
jgi:hypothetical protein